MTGQLIRSLLKRFTPTALLLLEGCAHIGIKTPNAPSPPLALACSVNPTAVFPGQPVTVTATGMGLNPNVIYFWTGEGVTASGLTATVNTKTLVAGNHTVQATVEEGKRSANCSVTFTVKKF